MKKATCQVWIFLSLVILCAFFCACTPSNKPTYEQALSIEIGDTLDVIEEKMGCEGIISPEHSNYVYTWTLDNDNVLSVVMDANYDEDGSLILTVGAYYVKTPNQELVTGIPQAPMWGPYPTTMLGNENQPLIVT